MEFASGNIYMRRTNRWMEKDQLIVGHKHHFDHTTIVTAGCIELSLLKDTKTTADGRPLQADIEQQWIIDAEDDTPWQLILAGRFHMLRAVRDKSSFLCVYAHQAPQAISIHANGELAPKPLTRRDEDGLWLRVNPDIVQVTSEWSEAYGVR